ncbi:unnamed protein product [Arctia plantaginis]|uniref:Uncharacterized protein n=1 Tax=Arctia plantaginis TaxID=874455 RepID=A0A8S1A7I8_ARCPL|nr:unnamed protein product [Arctia plantaginis]CAB3256243.1 unnamed protein product [Arctia plantaginis]
MKLNSERQPSRLPPSAVIPAAHGYHTQHLSSHHHQSIPIGVNKRGGAADACCVVSRGETLTGQQSQQRQGRQHRGHSGEARAYHTRARCASTPARSCGLNTRAAGPSGARRGTTGRARPLALPSPRGHPALFAFLEPPHRCAAARPGARGTPRRPEPFP